MDADRVRRVRVRGDDGTVRRTAESVGVEVVAEGATADCVVVVGDALFGLADDPPDVPVLPVADGRRGRSTVDRADVADALRSLVAGNARRRSHPVLGVRAGESVGRAVADVSLVTSEAASISEYVVETDGRSVTDVRADGVVVATPLGSAGYARTAGGPVLAVGTGVVVVPVAPFVTDPVVRVVRPRLTVSVERDGAVSLVVDGDERCRVGPGRPVTIRPADRFDVLLPTAPE